MRLILSILMAACLMLLSTTARAQTEPHKPLQVVVSFSILADLVSEVGGPLVEVYSLLGPDSDAHVFSPTPGDAKRVAQADVVIVNGLGFEGWMDRLVTASDFPGPVIVASDGVTPIEADESGHRHAGHDHGSHDPHAWQDLGNVMIYVQNIRDALVEQLPDSKPEIETRAQAYIETLSELDEELKERFSQVPPTRKVLVSHDAFQYLAQAYDLNIVPVQGRTTEREVSAAQMAQLIRDIRDGEMHAYFIENMADPRMMLRVAQETELADGGRLYSDALSAPGTDADTFVKMYQHNAQRLLDALMTP